MLISRRLSQSFIEHVEGIVVSRWPPAFPHLHHIATAPTTHSWHHNCNADGSNTARPLQPQRLWQRHRWTSPFAVPTTVTLSNLSICSAHDNNTMVPNNTMTLPSAIRANDGIPNKIITIVKSFYRTRMGLKTETPAFSFSTWYCCKNKLWLPTLRVPATLSVSYIILLSAMNIQSVFLNLEGRLSSHWHMKLRGLLRHPPIVEKGFLKVTLKKLMLEI